MQLLHEMLVIHINDDVECQDCLNSMDCVADLTVAGKDPAQALPAIMAHIKCCPHCNEEYHALVKVLVAMQTGQI